MQILSPGNRDGTFAWEAILDEDTQNQYFFLGEFLYTSGNDGSLPPTYPSPEPTLTLTSHLEQNVGLGEG